MKSRPYDQYVQELVNGRTGQNTGFHNARARSIYERHGNQHTTAHDSRARKSKGQKGTVIDQKDRDERKHRVGVEELAGNGQTTLIENDGTEVGVECSIV